MAKLLIIPDGHAHPDFDNDRFTALGNFIMDERPDIIVCLGDLADLHAFSRHEEGVKAFAGTYEKDFQAVWDAQDKMFGPMNKYNASRAKGRHKRYKPKKIITRGNHEDGRIETALTLYPKLQGTIGIKNLRYEEYGWHAVPYKESITIEGIQFSHFFASGLKGQAISGENIGSALVKKLHMSAVQGHSHLYSHYEHTRPDGQKIFGLSAGCYAHKDFIEGWNRNTAHMWWHGVVMLEGAGRWPGYYEEIRSICQSKILERYL